MEYIVKRGFFPGKKKAKYEIGDVLEETELYKDRLDYFCKIGMLSKKPITLDVDVKTDAKAKADAEAEKAAKELEDAKAKAKAKKGKKVAKDDSIL